MTKIAPAADFTVSANKSLNPKARGGPKEIIGKFYLVSYRILRKIYLGKWTTVEIFVCECLWHGVKYHCLKS